MPEYDIVALVVNDTQYGGSGGFPLIASINSQSGEIATHELGHSFANLGDEYSSVGGYPSLSVNTASHTNLALIEWNLWITDGTPIPTPDVPANYNVIGCFQGAGGSTNYYRPKHTCKMRGLGSPFCEVCSEALITTIYSKLPFVQGFSPDTNQLVNLTNGLAATFVVSNLVPSTHSIAVQWLTNGYYYPGATSEQFAVSGFDLPAGTNSVVASVSDPTTLVRKDAGGVMTELVSWSVSQVVVPPNISIASSQGLANLTWPAFAAGFNLERAATLPAAGAWTPLLLISNQTGLSLPETNVQGFFRLHR